MNAYPIHTVDTAPAPSRDQLQQIQATLGQIPSLAAGMAESPTLLRSFFTVREIYAQGTLSQLDIQVLSLVNAMENDCDWCVAFHSALALKNGLQEDALAAIRDDRPTGIQRLDGLTALTRGLIRTRGNISAEVLEAFLSAGFTRAQALEVVLGIGFSVMANFAGHLIQPPLDAGLEKFAWART